jgi:hypothetical protein
VHDAKPGHLLYVSEIGEGRINVGEPHVVVEGATFSATVFNPNTNRNYAATRDGKRFFLLLPPKKTQSLPTTLILNWPAVLKKN